MRNDLKNRNGFTLTELLVVIAIILVLAGLSLVVFNATRSSDRMRSAARNAQSALMGAKDLALHGKDYRGVRLTRDLTNLNLINGFVYLSPLDSQSVGNITTATPNDFAITRPGLTAIPPYSDAIQLNFSGTEGSTIYNQDVAGLWPSTTLQIRIPAGTGQWFQLRRQSTTAPYWLKPDAANPGNYIALLQTGYPGGTAPPAPTAVGFFGGFGTLGDPNASAEIKLGNDMLPFHQPISLPSACVIDLAFCNSSVQTLAGYIPQAQALAYVKPGYVPVPPIANIDVMFSARGNVTGPVAALGALFFCIRSVQDASLGLDPGYDKRDPNYPQSPGDCLILAVFPQTGLVQTYEADLTDVVTNATGAAGSDGAADNIFSFAQRAMSAGR